MIEVKSITAPEEVRAFDGGRVEIVWVGGTTVARATFEPGFRWSDALGPKVGAKSCHLHHTGYVVSGRLCFAPDDDGDEVVLSSGDVFDVPGGHDTWVVGDEPAVILDFTGDDHLAKMLEWSGT
ncbi:MAG TPA: cupin domain-containing protein [Acidimicrobiia bacterium]|nr:cupin domain-containing protein [Acidimicrobiia bacterium]